jgi:hypothetical protein
MSIFVCTVVLTIRERDSKWSVSYLKSLPSKWSSSVETAPRPDPSTNIEVCQRDCVAHLYLLEKFAIVEKRVADIALEHNVDASLAWCAYVNLAIGRFVKWISRLGADRTHDILPPLDVLLVWHAFLQHPERWTAFCNLAGVPIESWSWHILVRCYVLP